MKILHGATVSQNPGVDNPGIRTAAEGESWLSVTAESRYNKIGLEGLAGKRHYRRSHRGLAGNSPSSMTPPSKDRVGTF